MNSKKWMVAAGVVGLVVVIAIALVPVALAQGPEWNGNYFGRGYNQGFNNQGSTFNRPFGFGPHMGRGGNFGPGFNGAFGPGMGRGFAAGSMFGAGPRWGGPEHSLIAVAAEQLGMEPAELITELQSGKTVAQVAEEKGVALQTIVDAFLAPRAEQLTEMVNNGQLTQEQADALLAMMTANVTEHLTEAWSSRGYGPGFVDEDGDGVCDYAGTGRGPGFVDEDGDGVCDHAGTGQAGQYFGGRHGGRMMGRWTW